MEKAESRFAAALAMALTAALAAASCTPPEAVGPPRGPVEDEGPPAEDPCKAVVCDAPNTVCLALDGVAGCTCASGFHPGADGSCVDDPCDPNPCPVETGKAVCAPDGDGEGATCSCDERYFDDDGEGGCTPRLVELDLGTLVGADLLADPPTYDARLIVIDERGVPVVGAAVTLGGAEAHTDLDGRATFPGLPADEPRLARVEHEDFLAAVRRVGYAEAGGAAELRVRLVRRGPPQELRAEDGGALAHGPALVQFPPLAFAAGDAALRGTVEVTLTSLDPSEVSPAGAALGDPTGFLADGTVRLLRPLGMLDVELRTPGGDGVSLAPLPGASLAFLLPAGAGYVEGDTLPLLSLDEDAGVWVQESSCDVALAPASRQREGRTLECTGSVHHFSRWIVAEPAQSLCVSFQPTIELPAQYDVVGISLLVRSCVEDEEDGLWCEDATLRESGVPLSRFYQPADAPPHGALCQVSALLDDPARQLRPLLRGTLEDNVTGRTIRFEHPLDPIPMVSLAQDGFATDDVGALEYGDPDRLCLNENLCRPLTPQVTIESAPAYIDADNDGYYIATSEDLPPPASLDCNDRDRFTYPGAPNSPCDGRDTSCAGFDDYWDSPITLAEATAEDVLDSWNGLCFSGCALPESEITGNSLDEDCDLRVLDRDGDGAVLYDHRFALPEPWPDRWDCDDTDPLTLAGQAEEPGNGQDEDCDGVALDADGDGWAASRHAAQWNALPEPRAVGLGDCNDHTDDVHPGADVAREAALAPYFELSPSGVWVRKASFCALVDENGYFTRYSSWLIRDWNCDGEVTDLDGDGWARPRHRGLGPDRAYDCNDYDPRVRPVPEFVPVAIPDGGFPDGAVTEDGAPIECRPIDEGDGGAVDGGPIDGGSIDGGPAGGGVMCGAWSYPCRSIPPGLIENETECEVAYSDDCTLADGGLDLACASALCEPVSGAPTTCVEAVGGGLFVCAPPGWQDHLPPRTLKHGEKWGPCDLSGVLPACPEGTVCGAPIDAWTDAYTSTLERDVELATGEAIDLSAVPPEHLGMCFPLCEGGQP